jgi:hypothetical protein
MLPGPLRGAPEVVSAHVVELEGALGVRRGLGRAGSRVKMHACRSPGRAPQRGGGGARCRRAVGERRGTLTLVAWLSVCGSLPPVWSMFENDLFLFRPQDGGLPPRMRAREGGRATHPARAETARAGRGSSFGVVHRRSPPSCSGNRMRDTPRSPLPRATRARGARPPWAGYRPCFLPAVREPSRSLTQEARRAPRDA